MDQKVLFGNDHVKRRRVRGLGPAGPSGYEGPTRRERTPPLEPAVSDPIDDLLLDLLEWIALRPRPYSEVMEAWRTSCPRLPVWEEANERGFVERHHRAGLGTVISITPRGREFLDMRRPLQGAQPGTEPQWSPLRHRSDKDG